MKIPLIRHFSLFNYYALTIKVKIKFNIVSSLYSILFKIKPNPSPISLEWTFRGKNTKICLIRCYSLCTHYS